MKPAMPTIRKTTPTASAAFSTGVRIPVRASTSAVRGVLTISPPVAVGRQTAVWRSQRADYRTGEAVCAELTTKLSRWGYVSDSWGEDGTDTADLLFLEEPVALRAIVEWHRVGRQVLGDEFTALHPL